MSAATGPVWSVSHGVLALKRRAPGPMEALGPATRRYCSRSTRSAQRWISLVVGILIAAPLFASDHIDGPVTTAHRVADLADLFAFPTPAQPGFLTIILDAYPLVPGNGHFSDKVTYTILVRRASIRESGGSAYFETGEEVALDCTFETPEVTANHVVTCASANGLGAQTKYGAVSDADRGAGIRLYAGMRADPFFLNADFFSDAIAGKLDPPDASNTMIGANVLSLVLELDLGRLYGNRPALVAVAAETTTRDAPGAPLRRLDRVGRPEITNLSMAPRNEPDLRDLYNLDRPFRVSAARQNIYQEKLARNIAFFDALDGRKDWPDRERDELARLIADDSLIVDVSKPCPAQSFLEIERSVLQHKAHQTCGGRRPDDDIMDALYTLYVAGWNGRPVRDGVDRPAAAVAARFPYLAAPDLGFWSMVRVSLARWFLGIPDRR